VESHDVKRFTIQKPEGFKFIPGQATEVSINTLHLKWKATFTFTSLNDNEQLKFTIKIYDSHNGVTKELAKLKHGDELIIRDVWGAIEYKGEGVFAGGAGVTFHAIFRKLRADDQIANNKLILPIKPKRYNSEKKFNEMLGKNFITTLTDEKKEDTRMVGLIILF
jgi:ferredoxin-NADP reductase